MKTAITLTLIFLAPLTFPNVALSATKEKNNLLNSSPHEKQAVSPARKINHRIERNLRKLDQKNKSTNKDKHAYNQYRTINGSYNNKKWPLTGAAHTPLVRLFHSNYSDGLSTLAGSERASARTISNQIVAQENTNSNSYNASDFLWQWGQFLDHDIDLTDGVDPVEPAPIAVPANDLYFAPNSEITFNRSIYDTKSPDDKPRQQINEITAWIDGSNVYGSSLERANALRTLDNSGQLKTSEGNYLPYNKDNLPNAGGSSELLFLAGDVRANEQVGLTAMHTLFVREHNRIAKKLKRRHPKWSGEKIYQTARKKVGAQIQAITYNEFLPALLGRNALKPYKGYRSSINAGIANVFSTAAYRFGHSALSSQLKRIDRHGNEIAEGHLSLREAFFSPHKITDEGGIEPILRGLASQACQAVDALVIDDIRNFLFGAPGNGGFDLASLNIQRGRDHGLPSYNDIREAMGFERAATFSDITRDESMQEKMKGAYGNVDNVDLWMGGLAEDNLKGSHLGPLFHYLIVDQFEALRNGDRFWYQNQMSRRAQKKLSKTRLSDIIRRNTNIGKELPNNVFYVKK